MATDYEIKASVIRELQFRCLSQEEYTKAVLAVLRIINNDEAGFTQSKYRRQATHINTFCYWSQTQEGSDYWFNINSCTRKRLL